MLLLQRLLRLLLKLILPKFQITANFLKLLYLIANSDILKDQFVNELECLVFHVLINSFPYCRLFFLTCSLQLVYKFTNFAHLKNLINNFQIGYAVESTVSFTGVGTSLIALNFYAEYLLSSDSF